MRPKLPSGRVLPPEPPIPKAKASIGGEPASASVAPSVAPDVGPFVPLGLRTTTNPLLHQSRGRSVSRTPRNTTANTSSNRTEPSGSEEVVVVVEEREEEQPPIESVIEPVPETPAPEHLDPPPARRPVEPLGPPTLHQPVVTVTPSLARAANLIGSGVTTLLALDIHKVADRTEAATTRLLQRVLREAHIGVLFLSYAVIQTTRDGAAESVRRVAEPLSFTRRVGLPIVFTDRKTGRGGKGERLTDLVAFYNRSRARRLESVVFIDDQSHIARDVCL